MGTKTMKSDGPISPQEPLIHTGEQGSAPTASGGGFCPTPRQPRKKIGTVALVALIYFSVSGGPFGMEEAVKDAGPLVCLVGMGILPIFWSVPEALVTAELAPAFPEAAGYVAWAVTAFGPFWGWMKGWLSWTSGVADNALYPVLILDYMTTVLQMEALEDGSYARVGTLFAITAVLTYLNYRGLDIVGETAIVICSFGVAPFLVMFMVGVPRVELSRLTKLPPGGLRGVRWTEFINMAFWNLNYWNSASPFAGDVRNPGRAFPRAMAIAIVLVMVTTVLPLLVGIGATDYPQDKWEDGFFAQIGTDLVGPWLGWWITLAASSSCIGMFESEMSSDSFQVMGMAERGMLPSCLAKRSVYGTPTYAILLSAMGIGGLMALDFVEIVEVLNMLYCFSQLIEFAAFIKLRVSHPDLHRPFRIPVNTAGACFLLTGPLALLGYVMYMGKLKVYLIAGAFAAFGGVLYFVLKSDTVRGCCHFLGEPGTLVREEQANYGSDGLAETASPTVSSGYDQLNQEDVNV